MGILQFLTAEWIAVLALRWTLIVVFVGFAIAKLPKSEGAGFADYVRQPPVLRWGPRLLGARLFSIAVALAELAVAALLFLGTFSATLGFLGFWVPGRQWLFCRSRYPCFCSPTAGRNRTGFHSLAKAQSS